MYMVKMFVRDEKKGVVYNPCGTSYSYIIRDLKTVKGVENRILRGYYSIPSDVVEVRIYQWNGSLKDENSGLGLLTIIKR